MLTNFRRRPPAGKPATLQKKSPDRLVSGSPITVTIPFLLSTISTQTRSAVRTGRPHFAQNDNDSRCAERPPRGFIRLDQVIVNENDRDPLHHWSMSQLDQVGENISKLRHALQSEDDLFSARLDLGQVGADELKAMLSDVRESSKKLSIVLSSNSFQNHNTNSGQPIWTRVQGLTNWMDPDLLKIYDVASVFRFLSFYPSASNVWNPEYPLSGSTERLALIDMDNHLPAANHNGVVPSADGVQELENIASLCHKLAEAFQKHASDRREEGKIKVKKTNQACRIVADSEELFPLLLKHVLRVGLGKNKRLNISYGSSNVNTIYGNFTYAAVEEVHREVEDARDLILQEMTIRRLRNETPARAAAHSLNDDPGQERWLPEAAATPCRWEPEPAGGDDAAADSQSEEEIFFLRRISNMAESCAGAFARKTAVDL